jgi:molybdate transport system permease protein
MRVESLDLNAPIAPARRRRKNNELWRLAALPLLLFIALPVIALFLRLSPADLIASLRQPAVLQAIRLSLVTSLATVALTLLFGTPVAYLLYRRRSSFYRFVDTLVDLPTVLPPAVAGVALLIAFGRQGLLGGALNLLGISIPFTTTAVILAQTFIAAPLYVRSAALGFAGIDCELKKAAALDGASRWQVFRHIMVPMAWMSIVSGSALTWARAMGEFGATIIFAGNFPGRTQTMPLAIYLGFERDLDAAVTLAIILVLASFTALLLARLLIAHEPE